MQNKLENVSTEDLIAELKRRKDILLNGKEDLSSIPLEYIISEFTKIQENESLKTPNEYNPVKDVDSKPKILFNAIKTPDGTVISSRHVHDYVVHVDSITGKLYGVDGGASYLKRTGDMGECEDLSIVDSMDFSQIRKKFHWGSYGKDGDQKVLFRPLESISNSHLNAILENVRFGFGSKFKEWFEQELEYRKKENIFIGEY